MVAPKVNVKENVTDGEMDLSMMDLQDVPVRDIVAVKKIHTLDLSNNHLSTLPKNFATLVNLIKIDLSKNDLKLLPENFGDLVKLKHLDLYKNQLQHLPLSFSKLAALKWLDLKDNPLMPSIAEVAGDCLDSKQCQKCAKDIVNLYSKLQTQVDEERKSREEQRQKSIEENAAKVKQEKKNKKAKPVKKQNEEVAEKTIEPENSPAVVETPAKCQTKIKSGKSSILSFTSILRIFCIFTLLAGISVIALKITKIKYGTVAEDSIREFVLSSNIPLKLKEALITIGEHVLVLENVIGIKAMELVGAKNINIVLDAFTGVYQNVTHASNQLYLRMFGK